MLSFPDAVRYSYYACCEKIGCAPHSYDTDVPTDAMVAEDILDNYIDYKDVDVSDPFKHLAWCKQVAEELRRQDLEFVEDK